jgi:uncharacterized protein
MVLDGTLGMRNLPSVWSLEGSAVGFPTQQILLSLSNEILGLILLPTEACNFRCVYCYEEFKYKRMEPWVVTGVKGLLSRRAPGLRVMTISWFGGEPLLALDLIEDVMLHVRSLAEASAALRFRSDATTNGYLLTPPVLERLVGLGVTSYQISFDGPREFHDRKRVLAGGKGTYDRIWGNLLAARESTSRFHIMVRLHADHENADAIPRFLDEYKEAFGSDPRFEIFIRGLSRLGGPNDPNLRVFEKDEGRDIIESMRGLARGRGLKMMVPDKDDAICYAAKANSFVVRANGRLNKCTVALEHPNNQVGMIHEDGTVEITPRKMSEWMRGLQSGDPGELGCPMQGYAEPVPLETAIGAPVRVRSTAQMPEPVRTVSCEKAVR